jgi:hypothetical protein
MFAWSFPYVPFILLNVSGVLKLFSHLALMSSKFISLPTEILVEVFPSPFRDIVAPCSRTCYLLRNMVLETLLWQYFTCTHRPSVEDGFPTSLTIPDHFARSQQCDEARNNLDAGSSDRS